jgi:hypothetical protein
VVETGPENQERPTGNVDRDARQGLVHRQQHVRVARDAAHVAERLTERLS